MAYQVLYAPRAAREVGRLPRQVVPRILAAALALSSDPRPPGCKKLRGVPNVWRIRMGDYRILYEVDDEARTVRIARAGHRRDIYE